jgi:orotidine-5'-phosphate decarboxylase
MNSDNQTHRRQSWQEVVVAAAAAAAVLVAAVAVVLSVAALGKCAHQAAGVERVMIPGVGLLLGAQADNNLKVLG